MALPIQMSKLPPGPVISPYDATTGQVLADSLNKLSHSLTQAPLMYLMMEQQETENKLAQDTLDMKWDMAQLQAESALYGPLLEVNPSALSSLLRSSTARGADIYRSDKTIGMVNSTADIIDSKFVPAFNDFQDAQEMVRNKPQTIEGWSEVKRKIKGNPVAEKWWDTRASAKYDTWLTSMVSNNAIVDIFTGTEDVAGKVKSTGLIQSPAGRQKIRDLSDRENISPSLVLSSAKAIIADEVATGKMDRADLVAAHSQLVSLGKSYSSQPHYQFLFNKYGNDYFNENGDGAYKNPGTDENKAAHNAATKHQEQELIAVQESMDEASKSILMYGQAVKFTPAPFDTTAPPVPTPTPVDTTAAPVDTTIAPLVPDSADVVPDSTLSYTDLMKQATARERTSLIPKVVSLKKPATVKKIPSKPTSNQFNEELRTLRDTGDAPVLRGLISEARTAYNKAIKRGLKPEDRIGAEQNYLDKYRNIIEFNLNKGLQRDLKGNLISAEDWAGITPKEKEQTIQAFIAALSR